MANRLRLAYPGSIFSRRFDTIAENQACLTLAHARPDSSSLNMLFNLGDLVDRTQVPYAPARIDCRDSELPANMKGYHILPEKTCKVLTPARTLERWRESESSDA